MYTTGTTRNFKNVLRGMGFLAVMFLAATAATAQTATNLDCTRCVDSQDIGTKSVTSAKLDNSAVTTNKIRAQSVTRSKIRAGAVTEGKLGQDVKDRLSAIESRSQYVSVPGAAVRPDRSGSTVQILANGGLRSVQSNDTFLLGGVQLPHGAEVLGLKCSVLDNDTTAYIQITLQRSELTSTSSDVISFAGTVRATADPGLLELTGAANQNFGIVDNNTYSYHFRVDMLDVTSAAMQFHGCSIELAP